MPIAITKAITKKFAVDVPIGLKKMLQRLIFRRPNNTASQEIESEKCSALKYLQSGATSLAISCLNHTNVPLKESNFMSSMFKPVVPQLVREQWKKVRSITFFLEFSPPERIRSVRAGLVTFFVSRQRK